MIKRNIPSSGEPLPVIGMGTWQTFDIDYPSYPTLEKILTLLQHAGGSLIDSSPMYGKAEAVVGNITSTMQAQDKFFYATKVWTTGLREGNQQIEFSFSRMRRTCIDLIQIHNLVDWQTHLPELRKMKEMGKIRYIGITHYTDDSHEVLEKILQKEPVDFVQFNYSIDARHAEKRLLDAAASRGVATLINRPLGQGHLFKAVQGKPLPPWAIEIGIKSWADYFLKYILAHPGVTCVIPATSNPSHALEILQAGEDNLPGEALKKKMLEYFKNG